MIVQLNPDPASGFIYFNLLQTKNKSRVSVTEIEMQNLTEPVENFSCKHMLQKLYLYFMKIIEVIPN